MLGRCQFETNSVKQLTHICHHNALRFFDSDFMTTGQEGIPLRLAKDVETLSNTPLLAKVDPIRLKLLAFTSERLEYTSGDELFHQDDHGEAVYVIVEGKADILVDSPPEVIKIATLGKNNIIGEIAILCDVPRSATVVAHGDLDTLRVSKERFFRLVADFPQVGVAVMSALAAKLHRTTQALAATRARLEELESALAAAERPLRAPFGVGKRA
jgi:CRP/FNR family cyclic AMP-dependent transcriptional regulator